MSATVKCQEIFERTAVIQKQFISGMNIECVYLFEQSVQIRFRKILMICVVHIEFEETIKVFE